MAQIPNLKGIVRKEHIKTIGTGRYSADYCPWAVITELLNEHANGWLPDLVTSPDGKDYFETPVGAYVKIRFVHTDGTATPAFPQSLMDHKHNSIPIDKITSRDLTDAHRRGLAMAAAAVFSLGSELWSGSELESGFARILDEQDGVVATANQPPKSTPAAKAAGPQGTKEQFLEAALEKGLTTHAAEELAKKLNGNFAGGIDRLKEKDAAWVKSFNEACAPKNSAEQW